MKLNRPIICSLAAVALAGAIPQKASATKVFFQSLRDDYYLIDKATDSRIDFGELNGRAAILDLTPGTYTMCGTHPNDKKKDLITFDFEVLSEDNYELKTSSTFGEYHYYATIGFGYYYLSQSYKDEDNKSVTMRGGVDFTIDDIKLFDTDGNEVNFTCSPYYKSTTNEDKKDVDPSGYYILGFNDYTTTAVANPNTEKFPNLLPAEWSATLGTSVNSKTMTRMPEAVDIVFTYPADAEGHMYLKKNETHYIPFEFIEPTSVTTEDGITTKRYHVGSDSRSYNYRVSRQGCITCAGIFSTSKVTEINITNELLNEYTPDYYNHNVSTKISGSGTKYSDIFLNINQRHLLRMNSGDTYQIVNLRTWQLTNSSTGNYFIEPDYHWTVLNTSFQPDQSVVKVDDNGVLTAVAPGTAIVQVDYDAIRLSAMDGDLWSKLWAENMGTFVVTVDADADNAPADNIGLAYKPGKPMDAEHDILYYMSDQPGHYLTFTPTEGSSVAVANPVVDTVNNTVAYPKAFSTDNVTVNEDGSVTVLLTYGRNIIRTTSADGASNYQVLSAKPITCEITTPRADGLAIPGDEITFKFDGLFHVAGKLAGIYNSNCHVRFNGISTLAGTILGNGQYDFAGNQTAQSFTVTVPMDATTTVDIIDGCLDPEGYGSSPGAHRAVDYVLGMNPNFNAGISSGEYGSIPSQSYKVTPFNQIDRLLVKTRMGQSVIPVREAVLKEVFGENIHWEVENEEIAVVNDVWAVCPTKAGKTVVTLYADDAITTASTERTPLLVCDFEVEDVEGYIPVESIAFAHEGDLECKMDLSWGNWGNRNYLSTKVLPEDATDKTVHLTSSNPDMVTLGKKGNAEYDSNYCGLFWNLNNLPGESVVTARSADGRLKISTVVRWMRYADNVAVDTEALELMMGNTHQLAATVSPEYCSYPVEWSSDNEEVATVDDNGVVTPVGVGTANITASVEGRYSTSPAKSVCLVTVKDKNTGVAVIENEINSMYPNPCQDILNINAANEGTLCIYSLEGQLMHVVNVEAGHNRIDVSYLNSGLYIVRLGNVTAKLVKK